MTNKPKHQLGHCLMCDLQVVVQAWIESGQVKPAVVADDIVTVLAAAILDGAKRGHEMTAAGGYAKILILRSIDMMEEAKLPRKSLHKAGHA